MKILKWPLIYLVTTFFVIIIMAFFSTALGNSPEQFSTFLSNYRLIPTILISLGLGYFLLKEYKKINIKKNKISYLILIIPIIMNLGFNFLFFDSFVKEDYSNISNLILSIIGVGIIGPIIEELIFRGLVFNYLKEKFTIKTSLLLSSLIFGIIHFNPISVVYTFLLGLVLGYFYEKTNNIKLIILMHILNNVTGITVMYLLNYVL